MKTEKLILALDLDSLPAAEKIVDLLKGRISFFKIGLRLFTKEGPNAIEMVQQKGCKVFLDLKYHDIPNTVAGAAMEATRLGVSMFTIHTLGGKDMMERCRDSVVETAIKEGISRPKVIGVTVLTSMDQRSLNDLGINGDIEDLVSHLSENALKAGLDGVVTSPAEVATIRERYGKDFIIVTPGIRPVGDPFGKGTALDDQKRIMTPKDAIKEGANYLVIGRPILTAEDPLEAVEEILKDIS